MKGEPSAAVAEGSLKHERRIMSAEQLKALSRIIRSGWKEIANIESQEFDTAIEVAKSILDDLEKLELEAEKEV
jgi:hypothetical protein